MRLDQIVQEEESGEGVLVDQRKRKWGWTQRDFNSFLSPLCWAWCWWKYVPVVFFVPFVRWLTVSGWCSFACETPNGGSLGKVVRCQLIQDFSYLCMYCVTRKPPFLRVASSTKRTWDREDAKIISATYAIYYYSSLDKISPRGHSTLGCYSYDSVFLLLFTVTPICNINLTVFNTFMRLFVWHFYKWRRWYIHFRIIRYSYLLFLFSRVFVGDWCHVRAKTEMMWNRKFSDNSDVIRYCTIELLWAFYIQYFWFDYDFFSCLLVNMIDSNSQISLG